MIYVIKATVSSDYVFSSFKLFSHRYHTTVRMQLTCISLNHFVTCWKSSDQKGILHITLFFKTHLCNYSLSIKHEKLIN